MEKSQLNSEVFKCVDLLSEIDNIVATPSFLDICGKRTSESVHTSALCWLINRREFSEGTNSALLKLLKLLVKKGIKSRKNELSLKIENGRINSKEIISVNCDKEVALGKNGRIDLCLTIELEDNTQIVIWIENKIFSSPHSFQLERYYDQVSKNDASENHNIFVFLSIDSSNTPSHGEYIHLLYQELYDEVLFPLIQKDGECDSYFHKYLKEYTHTLTSLYHNMKPIVKSEISKRHQECLRELYDQYKEFFEEAILEYGSEEEKNAIKTISYRFKIVYDDKIEIVSGFTNLAVRIVSLLYKEGHQREEILQRFAPLKSDKTLGNIDVRFVAERSSIESKSCFSTKRVGNSKLVVNNQWNYEKAKRFISLVHKNYPKIKITIL